uniref:Uncharacterized protein n=1 Tax=Knipowitschia caucasica TaxID=637954 RepID=A0AAV2LAV4_KNICA
MGGFGTQKAKGREGGREKKRGEKEKKPIRCSRFLLPSIIPSREDRLLLSSPVEQDLPSPYHHPSSSLRAQDPLSFTYRCLKKHKNIAEPGLEESMRAAI